VDLRAYLETTTQYTLAAKLRVSQGLIPQWIHGITRITAERAIQIERTTGGKLSRYDLPDF